MAKTVYETANCVAEPATPFAVKENLLDEDLGEFDSSSSIGSESNLSTSRNYSLNSKEILPDEDLFNEAEEWGIHISALAKRFDTFIFVKIQECYLRSKIRKFFRMICLPQPEGKSFNLLLSLANKVVRVFNRLRKSAAYEDLQRGCRNNQAAFVFC